MAITGMQYVGLISFVVALTNLVPTFGPMIGLVIGGFILLIVGGNMFGVIGILLAVPCVAIMVLVYETYLLPELEKRTGKKNIKTAEDENIVKEEQNGIWRGIMKYRIATISDCEALTRIRMQMRQELDSDFSSELIYEKTLDFFKHNIENGTHIAFVCEQDRQIIATVGITLFEVMPTTKYPNGKVARLMNMYVDPFYRHKGIAKELLNCAMMYARKHQIGKVILNPSQMGKSLYENYGFQLLPDEYVFYLR